MDEQIFIIIGICLFSVVVFSAMSVYIYRSIFMEELMEKNKDLKDQNLALIRICDRLSDHIRKNGGFHDDWGIYGEKANKEALNKNYKILEALNKEIRSLKGKKY